MKIRYRREKATIKNKHNDKANSECDGTAKLTIKLKQKKNGIYNTKSNGNLKLEMLRNLQIRIKNETSHF